jgi:hypothetical protein
MIQHATNNYCHDREVLISIRFDFNLVEQIYRIYMTVITYIGKKKH